MQPDGRTEGSLADMFSYAQRAIELSSRYTFEEWAQDDVGILALEHLVQIVGEAARQVSDDFKTRHPEIPWSEIIGMRHIIVHRYAVVELEIVWRTATHDAPLLADMLRPLLPPTAQLEGDDLTP